MSQEQEIYASRWIQHQRGLKVYIGSDGEVTLTNGVTIYAVGVGFVDAVRKFQNIQENKTSSKSSCFN